MQDARYFSRIDWASFGAAVFLTELIYLWTLTPEIGLRNDGYSATAAMYGGVSMPAGFPLWSAWAWLFVKCLPIGSIGWRAALATSVAGSLASGIIALLVSRISTAWLESISNATIIRAAAGASAGLNFGLNNGLWRQAVIPDPWPMTNFLLCLTIACFLRWSAEPERRRYLHCAAFAYALTLTNSQICMALMPAVPFAVAIFDAKLGRDILLAAAVIYVIALCHLVPGFWPALRLRNEIGVFNTFGLVFFITGAAVAIKTRQLFSEWRALLGCLAAFTIGAVFVLDLPLVGMTNPPSNWGYPRTSEGFVNVLTRSQYDLFTFSNDPLKFLVGIECYFRCAIEDIGWPALLCAIVPFFFWRQMDIARRKILLTLVTFFIFLTLLMIAILQPTPDLQMSFLCRIYYSTTYILVSVLGGSGLSILARFFNAATAREVYLT